MGIGATNFSKSPSAESFRAWYQEAPAEAATYLQAVATQAGQALPPVDQLVRAPAADPTGAVALYRQLDTLGALQQARGHTVGWDAREGVTLAELLDRSKALPLDLRREALVHTLETEWKGLPEEELKLRLGVALATGYLLVDRGPGTDPADRTGWSERELDRVGGILGRLPPRLQRISSLFYLTRDEALELPDTTVGMSGRQSSFFGRLAIAAVRLATRALAMRGDAAGQALYDRHEVRLFSKLFAGSRLPGVRGLLEYTVIHEIAHQLLQADPVLGVRWDAFYATVGRHHAPNAYAQQNRDEGFAVAVGMYAVAPEALHESAPETFEFMKNEFGDSLAHFKGRGVESQAIQLFHGERTG